MELFRTFSHLDGTELKRNGTSYFVKIGTCNGTSYHFEPLERNLTSYIWNGTFDTTGLLAMICESKAISICCSRKNAVHEKSDNQSIAL